MSRSRSARMAGTGPASPTATETPRSRNSCRVASTASPTTSRTSTREACHSAFPDSILAMSSVWLMRRVSRSVSLTMIERKC